MQQEKNVLVKFQKDYAIYSEGETLEVSEKVAENLIAKGIVKIFKSPKNKMIRSGDLKTK